MNQAQEDRESLAGKAEWLSHTPLLEWMAAAIGLFIVVFIISFTSYHALHDEDSPPQVAVKLIEVVPNGSGFLARIRILNNGSQTAASLEVEGELKGKGGESEKASLTLSYLPGHSLREGGLFYNSDPRLGQFELKPVGYQEP